MKPDHTSIKLHVALSEKDIDHLIDALAGRIAYFKRYALDRHNSKRIRECEGLRARLERLSLKF